MGVVSGDNISKWSAKLPTESSTQPGSANPPLSAEGKKAWGMSAKIGGDENAPKIGSAAQRILSGNARLEKDQSSLAFNRISMSVSPANRSSLPKVGHIQNKNFNALRGNTASLKEKETDSVSTLVRPNSNKRPITNTNARELDQGVFTAKELEVRLKSESSFIPNKPIEGRNSREYASLMTLDRGDPIHKLTEEAKAKAETARKVLPRVIDEMRTTEITYKVSLENLKFFLEGALSKGESPKDEQLLTPEDKQLLTPEDKQLLTPEDKQFLKDQIKVIEQIQNTTISFSENRLSDQSSIVKHFSEENIAQMAANYSNYDHTGLLNIFSKLDKNLISELQQEIYKSAPNLKGLTVEALAITVIQRPPRYVLLMAEANKFYDAGAHKEPNPLPSTQQVKEIASALNRSQKNGSNPLSSTEQVKERASVSNQSSKPVAKPGFFSNLRSRLWK